MNLLTFSLRATLLMLDQCSCVFGSSDYTVSDSFVFRIERRCPEQSDSGRRRTLLRNYILRR